MPSRICGVICAASVCAASAIASAAAESACVANLVRGNRMRANMLSPRYEPTTVDPVVQHRCPIGECAWIRVANSEAMARASKEMQLSRATSLLHRGEDSRGTGHHRRGVILASQEKYRWR